MTNDEFNALCKRFADAEHHLREAMREFALAAVQMESIRNSAPPEMADAADELLARSPVQLAPSGTNRETTKH